MRYLCDACERLVEPARTSVGEGGLVQLYCSRCLEPTAARAGQPAPAPAPAQPAEVIPIKTPLAAVPSPEPAPVVPASERCPKCATAKAGRESCARCGLVFALYRPESDPSLEALRKEFEVILSRWGEPGAKEAVDRSGPLRIQGLARLCRHHLADFPEDGRARELLELITERSMAIAATAVGARADDASEASASSRRWLVVGVLLAALLLGSALASLLGSSAP